MTNDRYKYLREILCSIIPPRNLVYFPHDHWILDCLEGHEITECRTANSDVYHTLKCQREGHRGVVGTGKLKSIFPISREHLLLGSS